MAKIDRDAAIAVMFRRYHEAAKSWNERGKDADYGAMVALDRAGNELAKLPAEEDRPAFRWVPLAEALPENEEFVLITMYWGSISVGCRYAGGNWYTGDEEIDNRDAQVLAWAPLPAPYKEEEQDEQGAD